MKLGLAALAAAVAAAGLGLWLFVRGDAGTETAGIDAAAVVEVMDAASEQGTGDRRPAAGDGPSHDGVVRKVVPDREREQGIRRKVNVVLGDAGKVTDIRCESGRCRVEIEGEMDRVGKVIERLSGPGEGFAGEARQLRLEAPVMLGQDAGPYRFGFTLEF